MKTHNETQETCKVNRLTRANFFELPSAQKINLRVHTHTHTHLIKNLLPHFKA